MKTSIMSGLQVPATPSHTTGPYSAERLFDRFPPATVCVIRPRGRLGDWASVQEATIPLYLLSSVRCTTDVITPNANKSRQPPLL